MGIRFLLLHQLNRIMDMLDRRTGELGRLLLEVGMRIHTLRRILLLHRLRRIWGIIWDLSRLMEIRMLGEVGMRLLRRRNLSLRLVLVLVRNSNSSSSSMDDLRLGLDPDLMVRRR